MLNSISIIFATYNGSSTIEKTLQSLERLNYPENITFTITIVDNNSTDNTLEILHKYTEKLPLVVLQESRKGKNSALNKALTLIDELGELIIFSDDDVIFSEDVLEKYLNVANNETEYSLFGGKIIPHWLEQPPQEILEGIPQTVAFALTADEDGYKQGAIEAIKIHGPNMAVRKELFLQGMGFDESIGPSGNNYVMGSETDFLFRAEKKGYKAFYDSTIIVEHIIRPYQYTNLWLKNRAYKAGRSFFYEQLRKGINTEVPTIMGRPRWALKKMVIQKVKMYLALSIGRLNVFYKNLWLSNHLSGYVAEYKRQNNNVL
jgi:glycosyltransferase involved in cell wall biosynthesis